MNILATSHTTERPIDRTPRARRRVLAGTPGRLLVALASCVAMFSLLGLAAQPAAAAGYTNTATSSSGAYLQSYGVCGGAFWFNVRSTGFESLRIGTVTGAGTTWGAWTSIPQNASYRYNLPAAYQNKAYVVQGADWVGGRWNIVQVVTSFNRITNGDNYSTWFC